MRKARPSPYKCCLLWSVRKLLARKWSMKMREKSCRCATLRGSPDSNEAERNDLPNLLHFPFRHTMTKPASRVDSLRFHSNIFIIEAAVNRSPLHKVEPVVSRHVCRWTCSNTIALKSENASFSVQNWSRLAIHYAAIQVSRRRTTHFMWSTDVCTMERNRWLGPSTAKCHQLFIGTDEFPTNFLGIPPSELHFTRLFRSHGERERKMCARLYRLCAADW